MEKVKYIILAVVCKSVPIVPAEFLPSSDCLHLDTVEGDDAALECVREWTADSGFSAYLAMTLTGSGNWLVWYNCGLVKYPTLNGMFNVAATKEIEENLNDEWHREATNVGK